MARTAQTDYVSIGSADAYPLEPGLASSWDSLAKNCNHAYRYLNPTVINQELRENPSPETFQTQVLAAAPELVASYRIPVYGGAAGQTLGGTFWAFQSGAVGVFTGSIRVTTSAGTTTVSVVSAGGPVVMAPYSFTGLALATGGAPETVVVDVWTQSIITTLYVSNFTAWLEPSSTPLAAGNDGTGFYPQDTVVAAADQPLPTYRLNRLSDNAALLAEQRPGVALSWSADFNNLLRSGFEAVATLRGIERIPVRYGPKMTEILVYINGWCNDGTKEVAVWTDQQGRDGAITSTLPNNAAWAAAPTATWTLITVPLQPVDVMGTTFLHVEADGTAINPMNIYGACAWENA
jgi:hypothetical protein